MTRLKRLRKSKHTRVAAAVIDVRIASAQDIVAEIKVPQVKEGLTADLANRDHTRVSNTIAAEVERQQARHCATTKGA